MPLKANGRNQRFCQLLRRGRFPQKLQSYCMLEFNIRLGSRVSPTLCASSSAITRPVSIFCSRNTPRHMSNNAHAVSASTNRQLRSTIMSFPGEEVQSFPLAFRLECAIGAAIKLSSRSSRRLRGPSCAGVRSFANIRRLKSR